MTFVYIKCSGKISFQSLTKKRGFTFIENTGITVEKELKKRNNIKNRVVFHAKGEIYSTFNGISAIEGKFGS